MQPEPSFTSVVRRAHLLRVLVVYVSAGFGVLQAVDVLENRLGLPSWFFPGALILLLLGIPIVLATALVQSAHGHGFLGTHAADAVPAPGATGPLEATSSPAGLPAETAAPPIAAAVRPRPMPARLLTWRNALLGGVAAFTVLGFGTAGYMGMRAFGIGPVGTLLGKGVLKARDRVVIADIVNRTADPQLGAVVTEALRAQLEESPAVSVVSATAVRSTFRLMRRDSSISLTEAVAREVAARIGARAIVAGEVGSAGTGYVLTARVVSPDSDEVLASVEATARDAAGLIPALDELSARLRERIGESLRSIRESPPLAQVTTASLDALRRYSRGMQAFDRGDFDSALPLLQDAVAIDTSFASAYRAIGTLLLDRGDQRAPALSALRQALAHSERLSPPERWRVEGIYRVATGDYDGGVAAYRRLLELDPSDDAVLNNIGISYASLHESARADSYYVRALRANPRDLFAGANHAIALFALGQPDAARAALTRLRQIMMRHSTAGSRAMGLLVLSRLVPPDSAVSAADALMPQVRGTAWEWIPAAVATSELCALGRLAEADARSEEVERRLGPVRPGLALELMLARARAHAGIGDRAGGARALAAALRAHPLEGLAEPDRPYLLVAYTSALLDDTVTARRTLAGYDTAALHGGVVPEPSARHLAAGALLLARGRPADAVPELQEAYDSPIPVSTRGASCWSCALALLGHAWDAAAQPDSALVAYERFLREGDMQRLSADPDYLAPTHERLVDLYLARGDRAAAARHGAAFLRLWGHADPALQPRVAAMRRRLGALTPDNPR